MKILMTGATGFIGARLCEHLLARGDELICPARRAGRAHPRCRWIEADLGANGLPFAHWLTDVDAVVNAAGIFREGPGSSFDALHTQMPVALFKASVEAGVKRVVQVSALGADPQAPEAFLRSKHAADEQLLRLPLDATVVMPSLVFGSQGASSWQLLRLAAMPLLLLPAGGRQRVQPVHVDDVVAAVGALLASPSPAGGWGVAGRLPLVGPQAMTLRDYLLALRTGLGLFPAPELGVPAALMSLGASVGERLPGALLNRAAWTMLQRGSTARAEPLAALLGRPPRAARDFIAPQLAAGLRLRLQLAWLLPVLRLSLAAVWIATAVVSMGIFPVTQSHALLGRAGVPAALQPLALYSAAALDLALGVATLWPQRRRAWRRWLWAGQAALVLGYTAIISLRLPEFWLHPYGPLTKNLPLLAVLLVLWLLDRPERDDMPRADAAPPDARPWTT